MGKGNRNRNYQEAYDMSGASAARAGRANGKKKDRTTLWITLVIAVLLVGSLLLFVFGTTGIVDRSNKLAYTDNYKVDATMITYYEGQLYSQTVNQIYQYYYQLTNDFQTAYNYAQQYAAGQSYREGALDIVKELLILCEAAKAEGISLDSKDIEDIDEAIAQYDGKFSESFGRGVRASDIRKAIELQVLANKYYKKFVEDTEAGVTSAEMEKYIEENKAGFYVTDYLNVDLEVVLSDYEDDKEGLAAAKALVDEYAAKFEAAKTLDEFKTLLIEYTVETEFDALVTKNIDSDLVPDKATLNNYEQEMTADIIKLIVGGEDITLGGGEEGTLEHGVAEIKKALAAECNEVVNGAKATQAYAEEHDHAEGEEVDHEEITEDVKWLVDSSRNVGETRKIDAEDDTVYGYSVYMIEKPLHIDETLSRNVGHILIRAEEGTATEEETAAAKEKAEKILAEYRAGEQTKESFEALGLENTEDSNVFYDNVVKGQMVEEFENWLFDGARKDGDSDVVQTEFGFHVMLYLGEELLADANAKAGVVSEKYSEFLKANEGKVTIK